MSQHFSRRRKWEGNRVFKLEVGKASSRDRKTSVFATERTEGMRVLTWLRGEERPCPSQPLGCTDNADLYSKSIVNTVI